MISMLALTLFSGQADAGKILYITNGSSYNSAQHSRIAAKGHTITRLSIDSLHTQTAAYVSGFDAVYFTDHAINSTRASRLRGTACSGWAKGLTGRVILTGLHAEPHGRYDWVANSVDWLADKGGTGLFIQGDWSNTSYNWLCMGTFGTVRENREVHNPRNPSNITTADYNQIYASPANSAAYFRNWGQSYHYRFSSFPSDFKNLGDEGSSRVITIVRGPACADSDGDGQTDIACGGTDCNDSDRSIYRGAPEVIGDEIDQSCDGRENCFADLDDDGWRTTAVRVSTDTDCTDATEARASEPTLDCDDTDRFTYPGATEVIGDEKDQSCNGEEICYVDDDDDGWRLGTTLTSSDTDCSDPGEAVASDPTLDCDDADAATYPGAAEVVGDEKDQSCNGEEICFADNDNDGWRTLATVVSSDIDCTDSGEATSADPTLDCDDDEATTYPGAPETPYDGVDQDCNGEDECDVDDDGFSASLGSCTGSDCDDSNADINPHAAEVWYDGVDADCDGWSDFDADRDGHESADYGGDDCDDTDFRVNPSAEEIWYDGVDSDCDGGSDYDQDGDGFDSAEYGGEDCDDFDETVNPDAPEIDDGKDNDCNGVSEDDDTDGDGLTDEVEMDLGTDPENPDSDGDGVYDNVEVQDSDDPLDTDGDGVIDALDTDDDGDGLSTRDENQGAEDDTPLGELPDTDGDGTPDFRDTDSDGDGFDDAVEGDTDTDRDGTPDYLDEDSDDDGILDVNEEDADSDGDGQDDRVDVDDDGDGIPSLDEGEVDTDGDGTEDYLDTDSDDDGALDADEGVSDVDCDETANYIDANDADGPCAGNAALGGTYAGGGCSGASSLGGAGGLGGGVLVGLFGLLAVRRRRD